MECCCYEERTLVVHASAGILTKIDASVGNVPRQLWIIVSGDYALESNPSRRSCVNYQYVTQVNWNKTTPCARKVNATILHRIGLNQFTAAVCWCGRGALPCLYFVGESSWRKGTFRNTTLIVTQFFKDIISLRFGTHVLTCYYQAVPSWNLRWCWHYW